MAASTIGRCNRRALASELETSDRITNMDMKKMPMAIMTSNSENARRCGAAARPARCVSVVVGSFIV